MQRTPFVHICLLVAFLINSIIIVPMVQAQDLVLPKPGEMVHLSSLVNPPMLKGMKVNPNNPFRFEFILDRGDRVETTGRSSLQDESSRLIKYFLASLTIPEKDLWVNLSPYEKDRIVPDSFGLTEMGRDLLAQDYMLKQVTASLIYPEDEVGKKFWKRVYEEAAKKYGKTSIPVNTFNKVWIVPEKAVVYENAKAGTAYVVESKLKVMLEADYLSLEKNTVGVGSPDPMRKGGVTPPVQEANQIGSQIVREIVIPELTKEINEGANFAQLRQVYSSLILATWYKKKIKDSILSKVFVDKSKIVGVGLPDPMAKGGETPPVRNEINVEQIYQQYLTAFKKGVYNYIKEDIDPATQERIPRKYFSGGFHLDMAMMTFTQELPSSMPDRAMKIDVNVLPNQRSVKQTGIGNVKDQAMVTTAKEIIDQLNLITRFDGQDLLKDDQGNKIRYMPQMAFALKKGKNNFVPLADESDDLVDGIINGHVLDVRTGDEFFMGAGDLRPVQLNCGPCSFVIIYNTKTKETFFAHSSGNNTGELRATISQAQERFGKANKDVVLIIGGRGINAMIENEASAYSFFDWMKQVTDVLSDAKSSGFKVATAFSEFMNVETWPIFDPQQGVLVLKQAKSFEDAVLVPIRSFVKNKWGANDAAMAADQSADAQTEEAIRAKFEGLSYRTLSDHNKALWAILLNIFSKQELVNRLGLSYTRLFAGKTLDLGIESSGAEMSTSEFIRRQNHVTLLRQLGFDAVGISPLVKEGDPDYYYHGKAQDMRMFKDAQFDTVLSHNVFQELYWKNITDQTDEDYEKAAAEIYRVLKPGGIFFLTVPLGGPSLTFLKILKEAGFRLNPVETISRPGRVPECFICIKPDAAMNADSQGKKVPRELQFKEYRGGSLTVDLVMTVKRWGYLKYNYFEPWDNEYLVALTDGKPVGIYAVGPRGETNPETVFEGRGISVDPSYQGQGIATRLVLEHVIRLKQKNADSLLIWAIDKEREEFFKSSQALARRITQLFQIPRWDIKYADSPLVIRYYTINISKFSLEKLEAMRAELQKPDAAMLSVAIDQDKLEALASHDTPTRHQAALDIVHVNKPFAPQAEALIANVIEPAGIKTAEYEFRQLYGDKPDKEFNDRQARRLARQATFFALDQRLYHYPLRMSDPELARFWRENNQRLANEAREWLRQNKLSIDHPAVLEGTQAEVTFINKYRLGHRAEDLNRELGAEKFAWFENIRLFYLYWKIQFTPRLAYMTEQDMLGGWIRRSLDTIAPVQMMDLETRLLLLHDQAMAASTEEGVIIDMVKEYGAQSGSAVVGENDQVLKDFFKGRKVLIVGSAPYGENASQKENVVTKLRGLGIDAYGIDPSEVPDQFHIKGEVQDMRSHFADESFDDVINVGLFDSFFFTEEVVDPKYQHLAMRGVIDLFEMDRIVERNYQIAAEEIRRVMKRSGSRFFFDPYAWNKKFEDILQKTGFEVKRTRAQKRSTDYGFCSLKKSIIDPNTTLLSVWGSARGASLQKEDELSRLDRMVAEFKFEARAPQINAIEAELERLMSQYGVPSEAVAVERAQRSEKQGGFKGRVVIDTFEGKPLHRLTRDKVPGLLHEQQKVFTSHVAQDDQEYQRYLMFKLKEELGYLVRVASDPDEIDYQAKMVHEFAAFQEAVQAIKDQAMAVQASAVVDEKNKLWDIVSTIVVTHFVYSKNGFSIADPLVRRFNKKIILHNANEGFSFPYRWRGLPGVLDVISHTGEFGPDDEGYETKGLFVPIDGEDAAFIGGAVLACLVNSIKEKAEQAFVQGRKEFNAYIIAPAARLGSSHGNKTLESILADLENGKYSSEANERLLERGLPLWEYFSPGMRRSMAYIVRHKDQEYLIYKGEGEIIHRLIVDIVRANDERIKDAAMIRTLSKDLGGIDLNADKLNLQIQNAGEGIKFNVDPAMLKQLQNASGFVPVIVNIQPLNDVKGFLLTK